MTGESHVCSPYYLLAIGNFGALSKDYILSGRIAVIPRRISRSIRSAANILGTIITSTSLIAQIDMNVRNMRNLDRSLPANSWTRCGGFSAHLDGVSCDIWPLAKSENCQAEELGSECSDCHFAEVMGEDWSFESDGSLAEDVSKALSN